jgi:hypothetical protein
MRTELTTRTLGNEKVLLHIKVRFLGEFLRGT